MVPVSLDTETALIKPGLQSPPLTCVSLWTGETGSLLDHVEGPSFFSTLLDSPDVLIVGHSIAYDMIVIGNERPDLLPRIFDAYERDRIACTEIRAKLLDIAAGVYRQVKLENEKGEIKVAGYSLEDQAYRLLGRRLDKNTWRLRYGELRGIPLDRWEPGARQYPIEDARATFDVWQAQEAGAQYLEDQYRQARAAFWLRLMSTWGIHTDARGVEDLARETGREYERIASDLRAAGLLRPDRTVKRRNGPVEVVPGSRDTKRAARLLEAAYRAKGREVPPTKGGGVALDASSCLESGDPLLEKYGRIGAVKAILSKDLPMLREGIYTPIHSRFEPLKETGRTGSDHPNLQNLRRAPGIRECFVPRCHGCGAVTPNPGPCQRCGGVPSVFIATDFGGLELNTLAQVCYSVFGFSALGDMINSNIDPHLRIAEQLLGEPYDALKRIRKTAPHDSPEYQRMDNGRQTGKVANFGFPGGLGPAALVSFALDSYNVRITEDDARALKRVWMDTLPEMSWYFRWIDGQVNANPPLVRHLFSNRFRGGVGYTDACNSYFQGLGSDVAKAAGWAIARACYVDTKSPLYGFRMVLFVHDEFVTEGPEDRAHEAAQEQSRLMVEASRPWLPNLKPIEAEPSVMRRYSKNAKPVFVNGRLVPWETV